MQTRTARSSSSRKLNANDIEGAALAIVALRIAQPGLEEENELMHIRTVDGIFEEWCPRSAWKLNRTTAEMKAAHRREDAVFFEAARMLKKLRSSKDSLFRAMVGMLE
jgi:hypothetical protein